MSQTGATCPECKRPTILRIGGEWCPSCRGFVHEVHVERSEHEDSIVRTLRARL